MSDLGLKRRFGGGHARGLGPLVKAGRAGAEQLPSSFLTPGPQCKRCGPPWLCRWPRGSTALQPHSACPACRSCLTLALF